MVRSLKIFRFAATAAAVMMSATTAFTPTAAFSSASSGTNSRPLSPIAPLQATATNTASFGSPGSNLLERPAVVEKKERDQHRDTNRDREPDGDYILRIYNDNINTREYVAVCLVQVVGLCESRAFYTMQQAHQNGIAKVGEYNQEVAECYEEQLNEKGIVCDVVSAGGE
jgi:ATP-dependent Clp protease adapter protein ClpS